ncbi:condensation domain-containing protein [Streptomyces sp. NBC_00249]|uniref:condensation domain-containing protein n=1 Tax=Streptomyces sp. NBC_00249 TaxID=2975690 RepID=UPI002253CA2B|nr:condensation domain-containing protein [Streptomyces sp. NBC_00249]MCX5193846.1 condensation domain-containing protein [Streptomyces sp. NBC_00249]
MSAPTEAPSTARALPLTAIQQSMWTAYQVSPEASAYNIVMPLRLRGRVDPAAMDAAVTAVGVRQELLRSVFTESAAGVQRTVSEEPLVRLEFRDLDGVDEATLHRAAEEAGARPFRLESGAFRVVLLRRTDEDWVLVTSAHHIVSDFTSRWLLVRDVLDAYEGLAAGEEPRWRPIPGSYADHTAEELRYTASDAGARAAALWKESVAEAPAAELPLDRPRPALRSYQGGTVVRQLPRDTADGLGAAAATAGVTPFAYLLAVFQALTHRWTGQDAFVLGVPATSRMGRAQRDVIGCFLNTMPVRADFTAQSTFRSAAAQAGQRVMGGMVNVRYPCALAFPRATVFRTALFLVQMDRMEPPVPNVPPGACEGPSVPYAGLDIALIDVPQQEGQLDLLLRIEQTPDGVTAVFSYDTDVLDRETVARFADGYERMLAAAVAAPDTAVADVELAGAGDLEALLALGSGSAAGFESFDSSGGGADEFESFENAWEYR